jgi:hypothetical protein
MGLLDNLMGDSVDDPKTMGLLSLAASLSSGQKFMPALAQGLLARQGILADAEKQKRMSAMQDLQMQQHQLQLQQAQRAVQRQNAIEALPEQFMGQVMKPESMDNRDVGQPGERPVRQGPFDMAGYAQAMFKYDPKEALALQQYLRKDTTPIKLGPGDALIDPQTLKPVASNPKDDAPSALKEYNFAKTQGYGGSFLDFLLAQKRAGASQVSVNTGQHGFDNTLKLRGDFRSEPVYKAHQEMQSAYSQIQQALKAGTPVGDLAGATKVMKLLDPGSVVRESELGMAMAATGLMDRVQNYAGMIMNGNKLTPQQRKEFQNLADTLMAQSSQLYNAKRGEYGQIAQRNGLNVEDVTGGAGVMPRLPSVAKIPGAANPENDPLGLFSR